MRDILAEICAAKKEHVAAHKKQRPESALLREAASVAPVRGFIAALQQSRQQTGVGLIAEIKKASPSKGVIRADFSPKTLAEAYAEGGAACLSVLTDEPYFQGDDRYIAEAQSVCPLPVLRKDFMLEPYQIIESRVLGADCILIIMAALEDGQARELYALTRELGMDALVEVHDEYELERACTHIEPAMLGINNRDLKTLKIDLATSERLAAYIPAGMLRVGESGIHRHEDLIRLQKYDIGCFLVGESLMASADVAAATRRLLGASHD